MLYVSDVVYEICLNYSFKEILKVGELSIFHQKLVKEYNWYDSRMHSAVLG